MVEINMAGELQQLVQEEECEEQLSHRGEVTPPSTPARSQHPSKIEPHNSNVSVRHHIVHSAVIQCILN
jgi:hypothetical protein